jgi:hypothetical protein
VACCVAESSAGLVWIADDSTRQRPVFLVSEICDR